MFELRFFDAEAGVNLVVAVCLRADSVCKLEHRYSNGNFNVRACQCAGIDLFPKEGF